MSYPVYYVPAGDVLPIFFDSFDGGTGASITMSGLAVTDIEIYKDGSTTQRASDAGYTLLDTDGIDFDGLTGIHGFSIDTGDNTDASFYTVGAWFHVVVSAITIDAQTVSFVAAAFRIMAAEDAAAVPDVNVTHWLGTAASTPTVAGVPNVNVKTWNDLTTVALPLVPTTAGRALDVSAGGEAGLDWANIGSPTTAQNLSATNIDTDQVVASVTGAVGSVTGAVGSVTGNVGGNVAGSVASVTAGVTVTTNNDKTGYGLSSAAVQAIWDALTSALTTAGSIGKLLVDNINATISGRSSHSAADVWAAGTRTLTAATNITSTGGTTVPQTGDSYARLGLPAGASVSADIAAIEAQTDDIGVAGAGLTDLGGMSTTMKAQVESEVDDALGAGTGTALTAIPWNASWDAEVQSEVQDALDGTIADSVPADGTRPSISQALYMITQFLTEKAVSSTTVTVRKPDGSTALMTFTLDSATDPTSITRAS